MKSAWALIAILWLLGAPARASEGGPYVDKGEIGRYQIYQTSSPAGAFLLDTVTGRVWHLAKFSGYSTGPLGWQEMHHFGPVTLKSIDRPTKAGDSE